MWFWQAFSRDVFFYSAPPVKQDRGGKNTYTMIYISSSPGLMEHTFQYHTSYWEHFLGIVVTARGDAEIVTGMINLVESDDNSRLAVCGCTNICMRAWIFHWKSGRIISRIKRRGEREKGTRLEKACTGGNDRHSNDLFAVANRRFSLFASEMRY